MPVSTLLGGRGVAVLAGEDVAVLVGLGVAVLLGAGVGVLVDGIGVLVGVDVAVGSDVGAGVDVGIAWHAVRVSTKSIAANRIKTLLFIGLVPFVSAQRYALGPRRRRRCQL
ncbi:MAG TPA: hypothetical protein VIH29_04250 [Gallionella sp.]